MAFDLPGGVSPRTLIKDFENPETHPSDWETLKFEVEGIDVPCYRFGEWD